MRDRKHIVPVLMANQAAGVIPWYQSGGAPAPVIAYQPIGAASLAASYSNLANPGTNDAAPGVAPTWDATNGWIFNGTSQYLTTGYNWGANKTVIVRFTNSAAISREVVLISNLTLSLTPRRFNGVNYQNGATVIATLPGLTGGILAIAGANGYRNGVEETTAMENNPGTTAVFIAGNGFRWLAIYVQALAIYNSVLTAPQIAAVTTAMAALSDA